MRKLGLKSLALMLGLVSIININGVYGEEIRKEAQKDGAYWIEDNKGVKSDWYYIDPDNTKGNRWIKEFGYWYYIDSENKLVTNPIDKQHAFNDGSIKGVPYGALIEENQVKTKEKSINTCSYLEIKREGIEKFDKVVILLHGLSGVKEEYKYYGCEAASNSDKTLVIIPELYGHENDKGGNIPNIIVNTSNNIEMILKKYDLKSNCKIDILGCSLGGMIGAYFVENSTYKVDKLSLLISTVNFKDLEHDIFFKKYKNGEDVGDADKEKVLKDLEEIDIKNTKDAEVRMFNTATDYYMDYIKIGDKVEKLQSDACDIRLSSLDYNGHTVTKKEFLNSIDWFME